MRPLTQEQSIAPISTGSTLPEDLKNLVDRVQATGTSAFDKHALCVIARYQKNTDGRQQLDKVREAMRTLNVDFAQAERDAPRAKAGLNPTAIAIYNAILHCGSLEDLSSDQIRAMIEMKAADAESFKAFKSELKIAGVNPQALDRRLFECGDSIGEDPIQQTLDEAGVAIRALGHSKGIYYYQSSKSWEVIDIRADSHTKSAVLLQLANLDVWEACFPSDSGTGGANWTRVADWLMESCHEAGLFDPSRIRGLGAWYDRGRSILHLGNRLIIDGVETRLQDYVGQFIYMRGRTIPAPALDNILTDDEGDAVMAIFQALRWSDPLSGLLMAGWVCSAMICGAMSWRPHAWLTGGSGSGKTYIQSNIITPLMEGIALFVQSATTEAGLRHSLNADALPVIFDEAEAEDARAAARMQAIFELARQASSDSGGQIRKGSAGGDAKIYTIRSSFLFSSIVVSLKQQADLNRFAILNLAPPPEESDVVGRETADKAFADLQEAVSQTIQSDTSSRLFARLIKLIPVIVQNVAVFTKAAGKVLASQRHGDQYGVLLANAYALSHGDVVSEEAAFEWMEERKAELRAYASEAQDPDHDRAKRQLMQYQVRVETPDGSQFRTVGELIGIAAEIHKDPVVEPTTAATVLGRIGMKIRAIERDGHDVLGVQVHNNLPAIASMFADTPWSNGWNRVLGRLEGIMPREKDRFSPGIEGRSLWIPLVTLDIDDERSISGAGRADDE